MTRRRWIADEVHGDTAALTGDHAFHLARVLRARVGQEFDIVVENAVRDGKITSIADRRVEFTLGAHLESKAATNLTLVLAIFKFDRMEWAIEKCTELGVSRIIPLIARRTDANLAAAAGKRYERWQRIAREASEQSRRRASLEVSLPIKFKELRTGAVASMQTGTTTRVTKIVLAESGSDTRLRDVLDSRRLGIAQEVAARKISAQEVALAIGPEGGWTNEELGWFRQFGWTAASLGDTILRAETAAIVGAALTIDSFR